MFVELFCLVFVLVLIYYTFWGYPTKKCPPGPTSWPFIGNPGLMTCKNLYLYFTDQQKKFGNVFSIYMGRRMMVVLGGDAIKEALAFQPKEFSDRPPRSMFRFKATRSPSLFMMEYGQAWRLFRKLGHSSIKVYGQERLQKVMDEEVSELCKRLESLQGEPSDIRKLFGMSVTNVICHQLFGSRYEIDDPEFIKVFDVHRIITRVPVRRSLRDFFPFLKKCFSESDDERAVEAAGVWRDKLLERKYLEHLETFDPTNIRDYTDALIKAKIEAEEEDSSCKEYLTQGAILMAGLGTVFLAGSETTSTTLGWAIIYLVHNPQVQNRLHQEIDQVIDRNEIPKLSAKKSLPLLEAFTAETLRMSSILPLNLLHQTTVSTTFRGYDIPRGTIVVPNLWSLHHDASIWKDPFKFSLDRFLDVEGRFVNPPSGTFLPFSAGPRVCMGEVFARSELFHFLSRLLQNFRFENPPDCELPSLEGEFGTVMSTRPYKVCVTKRQ